ncbi:hypothetical protein VDGL01_11694 [Verticillium dahliae]
MRGEVPRTWQDPRSRRATTGCALAQPNRVIKQAGIAQAGNSWVGKGGKGGKGGVPAHPSPYLATFAWRVGAQGRRVYWRVADRVRIWPAEHIHADTPLVPLIGAVEAVLERKGGKGRVRKWARARCGRWLEVPLVASSFLFRSEVRKLVRHKGSSRRLLCLILTHTHPVLLPKKSYGRKVLFFLSPHGPTRLRRTGHQPQQRQGGTRSLEGFWLRDARCVMCDARCALRNCVGVIAYPRDCATTQMGKLPPVTAGTHRPGSGPRTNATAPTVHYKEVYVYL